MQPTSPLSASATRLDSRSHILQYRPKTAVVPGSEQGHIYKSNHQRHLSQDTISRSALKNEEADLWNAVLAEDRPVRVQTDCKRKKSSHGSAGLGEFRHGMRSMVRTASLSVKTALHSSKRSRKGSTGQTIQIVPTDVANLQSTSSIALQNTPQNASSHVEAMASTPEYVRLSRFAFLRYQQERRNAISGPGSHYAGLPPPPLRSGFLSSQYPPFLPNDPSQGAAARAAAAAASSNVERAHLVPTPPLRNTESNSAISLLPRDSESGIFVDSQDDAEWGSAVPLIRKGEKFHIEVGQQMN